MESKKRMGLIVYVHTPRHLKELRKYGTIYYFSRKMRFVVMYVDGENGSEISDEISDLGFVKQVIPSQMGKLREQLILRSLPGTVAVDDGLDDEEEP